MPVETTPLEAAIAAFLKEEPSLERAQAFLQSDDLDLSQLLAAEPGQDVLADRQRL